MSIQIRTYSSVAEKKKIFAEFSPKTQTWLVSDLFAKKTLKQETLFKTAVIEKDSVLRVSEFWRLIGLREFSDFEILEPKLALGLIDHWLQEKQRSASQKKISPKDLLKNIEFFLPLTIETQLRPLFEEWLKGQSLDQGHLQSMFDTSTELFAWFIDRKYLVPAWVPALLLSLNRTISSWQKDLIVDLGFSISPVEATLLSQLGQSDLQIQILQPELKHPFFGVGSGAVYEKITPSSSKRNERYLSQTFADEDLEFEKVRLRRFSTRLQEIKWAMNQVKIWQDQGVENHKIALIAPDIEIYLPVIQVFFETEGYSFDKGTSSILQGYFEIQTMLSSLRVKIGAIEKADLELELFSGDVDYEWTKFKRLFSLMLDEQDLGRDQRIKKRFQRIRSAQEELNIIDFINLFVADQNFEVKSLKYLFFERLVTEVSSKITLSPQSWVFVIEQFAASQVQIYSQESSQINIENIDSLNWSSFQKVIVLGMDQASFQRRSREPLGLKELEDLQNSLGITLGALTQPNLEALLTLRLNEGFDDIVFSFSESDFDGTVLTPSLLWLFAEGLSSQVESHILSPSTVIDRLLSSPESSGIEKALREVSDGHFRFKDQVLLSASSIERYSQCRFLFVAEKLFGQKNDPLVDLEVHPMELGSLLHRALLELKLRSKDQDEEITQDQAVSQIVDGEVKKMQLCIGSNEIWGQQKLKLNNIIEDFFRSEASWRRDLPNVRFFEGELAFDFFFEELIEDFEPQKKYRLRGQIDRVDRLADSSWIVADYKMQTQRYHHWRSWLDEGSEVQLALYAEVVETGLTKIDALPVSAGLYFDLKSSKRDKGFVIEEEPQLESLRSRYNKMSLGDRKLMSEQLKKLLIEVSQNFEEGAFYPDPKDHKICVSCAWRELCRSPHLN